ncbi:MAG: hypothetical protein ACLVKR_06165 [Lachnospiraceae bacterium]
MWIRHMPLLDLVNEFSLRFDEEKKQRRIADTVIWSITALRCLLMRKVLLKTVKPKPQGAYRKVCVCYD